MPTMKIISPDGTIRIVQDETWKNTRIVPRYNRYQPRINTLEVILESLRVNDGQTVDQLELSTNIPSYFLGKYLLELEKEGKIGRGGPRHYLLETPSKPTST